MKLTEVLQGRPSSPSALDLLDYFHLLLVPELASIRLGESLEAFTMAPAVETAIATLSGVVQVVVVHGVMGWYYTDVIQLLVVMG